MKIDNSLKNKLANVILISYISLYLIILILHIPSISIQGRIIFVLGTAIGFSIRILLIIMFWNTIMVKYIKEDKCINIIQLILGLFLILLALNPISLHIGFSFTETFIIISVVIIIKKDYKFIKKRVS